MNQRLSWFERPVIGTTFISNFSIVSSPDREFHSAKGIGTMGSGLGVRFSALTSGADVLKLSVKFNYNLI